MDSSSVSVNVSRPSWYQRFTRSFARALWACCVWLVIVPVAIVCVVIAALVWLGPRPIRPPQTTIAPAAAVNTPATTQPVQPVQRSEPAPSKPTRTWVDAHTRADGTKVKGHWRNLD